MAPQEETPLAWPEQAERFYFSSPDTKEDSPQKIRYPGLVGFFQGSWTRLIQCQSNQERDQPKVQAPPIGSKNMAANLQQSLDAAFDSDGSSLFFSYIIADPFSKDCRIIGSSKGSSKLRGHNLPDIFGRAQKDSDVLRLTKDFCSAVRDGKEYKIQEADRKPWMPIARPAGELICMQKSSRKEGTLFNNMYYLKPWVLNSEAGEGQRFVVVFQSELPSSREGCALVKNLGYLDGIIKAVKKKLSLLPQCTNELDPVKEEDQDTSLPTIPNGLHTSFPFDASTVQPFEDDRFKFVQKLCDATRNKGEVQLLEDKRDNKLVAAKRMPMAWLCKSHEEFLRKNPNESEMPWQDMGCTQFLNSMNFKYACKLEGVFSNSAFTYVNFAYAKGGDLFSLSQSGLQPGPEREASLTPLAHEILKAFKQLHDMDIVHRDISLENILLTSETPIGSTDIRIIDFAMASRQRTCNAKHGKPSYQAPEMHEAGQDYDAFLTDAFAVGVVLYSVFLKDYPWLSTKPGADKHFKYIQQFGFRSYCEKKKVRGSKKTVAETISGPLFSLLEGLLELGPNKRLSLGENQWATRRSVWGEPFTAQCSAIRQV